MKIKGRVFVVSAPSGAGKSSLCSYLVNNTQDLSLSVSYTTRQPRPGEINGKDYFFVDEKSFIEAVKRDEFAEYANVYGNYYGTSKKYLEETTETGINLLLEIDVQGAASIKEKISDAVLIFILPPSIEELKKRLENRGTDSAEIIKKRIDAAESEILKSDIFDYKIINDDFEQAGQELVKIVKENISASGFNSDG